MKGPEGRRLGPKRAAPTGRRSMMINGPWKTEIEARTETWRKRWQSKPEHWDAEK